VNLSTEEIVALQHALPIAWPQMDDFAIESEQDDPKLAAGYAAMAQVLRSLYERITA
jgi:hypothetical protein